MKHPVTFCEISFVTSSLAEEFWEPLQRDNMGTETSELFLELPIPLDWLKLAAVVVVFPILRVSPLLFIDGADGLKLSP